MFNHEISGFADSMHVGTQTSCDMVFIWARHQSSPPYLEWAKYRNILCLDNTSTDTCPSPLVLCCSYVVTVRMIEAIMFVFYLIKFG